MSTLPKIIAVDFDGTLFENAWPVEFRDGVRRVDPSSIKFCDEKNAVLCEMSKTP